MEIKTMIEQTASENLTNPSEFYGFKVCMRLKKKDWRSDEFSYEDKSNGNLPELSQSGEHFSNAQTISEALEDSNIAQDMSKDDTQYWEKEINEIMESLKRFQTDLAKGKNAVIEDVFNLRLPEAYVKEKLTNGENLKASIAEIEKLDALLKMKYLEEKQAKLSRLQLEEESRTILTNLTFDTMTNRIKMNSEEFLRLLHEADKLDAGSEESTKEEENKSDEAKEKMADEKNLKTSDTQLKPNFVERNIQLAKCGRGVLSITDEEKVRIETLLNDIADPETSSKREKLQNPIKPDCYALDDESKSILNKIDQRLEVFSREASEGSQGNSDLLENLKLEEDAMKENNYKKLNKPPQRLIAVNKLLNSINSTTHEEINPLEPEHINRLIKEANQSVAEDESKPSPEVIAELVTNAKNLMPKFKYRFIEN